MGLQHSVLVLVYLEAQFMTTTYGVSDHSALKGHVRFALFLFLAVFSCPSQMWASGGTKACDRECLLGFMDQYLEASTTHNPSAIPVSPNANIRENTVLVELGKDAWTKITAVNSKQLFADAMTGQVFFWGAVQMDGAPAAMSVRLKVENRKITEIETALNNGHDGPFNSDWLLEQDVLYQSPLPPDRVAKREAMIKVVDNYWEAVGTHNASVASFSRRCVRYENGRGNPVIAPSETSACSGGLANLKGQQTIERRYPVVDVERGIVISYTFLEHQERDPQQALYISSVAKVVDGKLRELDAVNHTVPFPATAGFKQ
jgi:hypothetical protein